MSQVLIPQKAKVYIILGLAVVGVALWKWDEVQKKAPSDSPEITLPAASAFDQTPNATFPESTPSEPQLKPATSSDNFTVWQDCVSEPDGISDLRELLEATVPAKVLEKAEMAMENLHLITSAGDELRLHTRPNDLSGKIETLLFGVDGDGYPLPQEFPDNLQKASIQEKKDWFLRQGQVSLTEKVFELSSSGFNGRWRDKNQQIEGLEIILSDRSVSCSESLASCRCRR